MNYSDRKTEQELHALEKKLSKEYKQAYIDISAKADEYFEHLKDRYEAEYTKYLGGQYTELEFKNWYATQVARGQRWNALKDQMARRIVEANQTASAYINDKTPSIYSINQNYQAYEIYKDTGMIDFTLYDEQTVKNLLTEKGNNIEFRTTKVNPSRDYAWNKEQIQKALSAGIMQGKGIDEIADSFMTVMQRNRNSAIRNARTAFTSAQNAGRLESMKQASDMGINVKKEWLATLDKRTRDSHMHLNGQVRELNEEFDNKLMYPADPEGEPEEVYNCRCTLIYVYDKTSKNTSNDKASYSKFKEQVTEQENSNKHSKNLEQETLVNIKSISSNKYRDKLDAVSASVEERRALEQCAKEILEHRNGTFFEDLAYINSTTGKLIINKDFDYYDKEAGVSRCKSNKPMQTMLNEAEHYTIIGVHNHPKSGAPSIQDIISAKEKRYKYGVALCHNETIYKYSIIADEINELNVEFALANLERAIYNGDKVSEALGDLLNNGIKMEVF